MPSKGIPVTRNWEFRGQCTQLARRITRANTCKVTQQQAVQQAVQQVVQQALVQTLAVTGLGQPANDRFRLDGLLLTLSRPHAGFAMTVTAAIAWRLTDVTNGSVVYDRTLQGLGTATLDDAVDNNNRLRIADQRAVRANLQQLVQDLYALPSR